MIYAKKHRLVKWTTLVQQVEGVCTPLVYSSMGYLKSRVYTTWPRTLDELKHRIQDEIRGIAEERPVAEMVSKLDVMSNLESSYCLTRAKQ